MLRGDSLWEGPAKTRGLAWPLGRQVSSGPQGLGHDGAGGGGDPDERGLCLPGGCWRVTGPVTKDWALQTTEERWGAGSPKARPGADTEMS